MLSHYTRVIAIDPSALDPDLAAREHVHHLRVLLRDDDATMAQLKEAMLPATQATFVVCDANIAPAMAAGLVASLARERVLAYGCKVVLTLKAQFKVRLKTGSLTRKKQEEDALEALGAGFGEVRLRWLFANTAHEVTLTAVFTGPSDKTV